jgi:hypothetical protein
MKNGQEVSLVVGSSGQFHDGRNLKVLLRRVPQNQNRKDGLGFQVGIASPADRTRGRLAPDLHCIGGIQSQPTVPAIQALTERWGRLSGAAIGLPRAELARFDPDLVLLWQHISYVRAAGSKGLDSITCNDYLSDAHQEEGPTPSPTCLPGQGGSRKGMRPLGNEAGRASCRPPQETDGGIFMSTDRIREKAVIAQPGGKGRSIVVDRRSFLGAVAGTLLFAPAVVRAASLMQVSGIILPHEWCHYGFLQRLYVGSRVPEIRELQDAGMTAHEVAAELNRRNFNALNGTDWDAEHVRGVVQCDDRIRAQDLIIRQRRLLGLEI